MNPRIFVSSTFYDLRYIREDLKNFIREHYFEPVLFEDGDIGYTPGQPLDVSCYEDMKNADLVMLIIGGQYGSAATGEDENFKEYTSVTRNEFKTAVNDRIPVFCFIEKTVQSEYEIYKINKQKLDDDINAVCFRVVKNLNVFRFIEEIKSIGNITIKDFEKVEDIKLFMGKQWAAMLKKHLGSLRDTKTSDALNNTMEGMETLLKQMKIMVDKIGEDTIKKKDDYTFIIDEQQRIEITNVADKITRGISIEISNPEKLNEKEKNVSDLLKGLHDYYTYKSDWHEVDIMSRFNSSNYKINSVIYQDDLIKKFVSNKDLNERLKKFLMSKKYYKSMFARDIHTLEPTYDLEKEEYVNYDEYVSDSKAYPRSPSSKFLR